MNKLTWFAKLLIIIFVLAIISTFVWLYKSLYFINKNQYLFDNNKQQIIAYKHINFYNYFKYNISVYNKQQIINKNIKFQDYQGKQYETNLIIIYKTNPFKSTKDIFTYGLDQFILNYFSKYSSITIYLHRDIHKYEIQEFLIKNQLEIQEIYLNSKIIKQ